MMFDRSAIWKLLIPLMIENLLASFMGMADSMMVTRIGSAAISAVSLTDSINNLVIQLFSAMATGGTILCSQYIGSGDPKKANAAARQVVLSMTSIAIVITLFSEALNTQILRLVFGSVEPAVLSAAETYFRFTAASFPFLGLYQIGAAFYRAGGNSRFPMRVSVITNVMNIIGNAIFIFGFGWGLRGAALATTLSMTVSALQVVRHLFFSRHPIQLTTAHLGIDRQWLGVCLGMGFAPFLAMACEALVGLLYNASLSTYGGDVAVGAMAVYYVIGHIIAYLIMGLSMAMQPMISYNFGMRSFERVRQCTHLLITWSVAICSVIWFVMMVAPGGVCRLFTNDAEIATFASRYLRTYFFAGFLTGVPFVCMNTLRFVRQVKQAIGLVVFRRLLLSVPLIWLLPRFGGLPPVQAILMAAPIIDGVSAAVILCLSLRTIHHLQEA